MSSNILKSLTLPKITTAIVIIGTIPALTRIQVCSTWFDLQAWHLGYEQCELEIQYNYDDQNKAGVPATTVNPDQFSSSEEEGIWVSSSWEKKNYNIKPCNFVHVSMVKSL